MAAQPRAQIVSSKRGALGVVAVAELSTPHLRHHKHVADPVQKRDPGNCDLVRARLNVGTLRKAQESALEISMYRRREFLPGHTSARLLTLSRTMVAYVQDMVRLETRLSQLGLIGR
jgi:hypothetical protein